MTNPTQPAWNTTNPPSARFAATVCPNIRRTCHSTRIRAQGTRRRIAAGVSGLQIAIQGGCGVQRHYRAIVHLVGTFARGQAVAGPVRGDHATRIAGKVTVTGDGGHHSNLLRARVFPYAGRSRSPLPRRTEQCRSAIRQPQCAGSDRNTGCRDSRQQSPSHSRAFRAFPAHPLSHSESPRHTHIYPFTHNQQAPSANTLPRFSRESLRVADLSYRPLL